MKDFASTISVLLVSLCLASSDAFPKIFQSNGFYKSMATTIAASNYNTKEAEIFSKDIQRVISIGPIPLDERQFLINGWRWHTSSALRDLQRYSDVIDKIESVCDSGGFQGVSSQEDFNKRITSCYNYVCDFNLKALMKIESDLFFPWLQRLLPAAAQPLMVEIVQDQSDVRTLSSEIGNLCKSLSGNMNDLTVIHKIGDKVRKIRKNYMKLQSVQETIFVPFITAYIPKKEQERFNRGVISNLGFIKAQVHLCGMIEALKDQPIEMSLLRSQIPSIAQATLPLWKKRIYDRKTACLNFNSQ